MEDRREQTEEAARKREGEQIYASWLKHLKQAEEEIRKGGKVPVDNFFSCKPEIMLFLRFNMLHEIEMLVINAESMSREEVIEALMGITCSEAEYLNSDLQRANLPAILYCDQHPTQSKFKFQA